MLSASSILLTLSCYLIHWVLEKKADKMDERSKAVG
jgi:hypothetical protein